MLNLSRLVGLCSKCYLTVAPGRYNTTDDQKERLKTMIKEAAFFKKPAAPLPAYKPLTLDQHEYQLRGLPQDLPEDVVRQLIRTIFLRASLESYWSKAGVATVRVQTSRNLNGTTLLYKATSVKLVSAGNF